LPQPVRRDTPIRRNRPRDTEILDAEEGSGWELARTLLRPRNVIADKATGAVEFVKGGVQRVSVRAALRHPFVRKVVLLLPSIPQCTSFVPVL
jgi:hypothetical protein